MGGTTFQLADWHAGCFGKRVEEPVNLLTEMFTGQCKIALVFNGFMLQQRSRHSYRHFSMSRIYTYPINVNKYVLACLIKVNGFIC